MKSSLTILIPIVLVISGCSTFFLESGNKSTVSSSLVDFLYPNEESRAEHTAQIPLLSLPVKVGIAFVPTKNAYQQKISLKTQNELLIGVKEQFLQYDYIDKIEIIPSAYLPAQGGFDALEQVSRLYDVDVMALVSYDQVSQTYENNAALLYWTIVGMYLIPGNENSIQTFVDTAVFDVKSRKMLFRAPGINKLEQRSTAVGLSETLDSKSTEGFTLAVNDMSANLDNELKTFKVRVKEEKIANVEHREGYSGGATTPLISLFLLLIVLLRCSSITRFTFKG